LGWLRWRRFFLALENTDRGAEQIDSVILKMPLLGVIWLKYQVANFSLHALDSAGWRIAAGAVT